jgi:hypothetical protein
MTNDGQLIAISCTIVARLGFSPASQQVQLISMRCAFFLSIKSLNYRYDDDNCAAASSSSSDFPMTIADSLHAIRKFTDSVRVNMQAELTGAAREQDNLHNLFHFN